MRFVPNAGDFRLLDRVVIEAFLALPERTRYNKGLFAWVGFRQHLIEHPRRMTHASVTDSPLSVREDLIRLSVGIEDIADLLADLRAALRPQGPGEG